MSRKRIVLHGGLKDRYSGAPFEVEAPTVAEAIKAFSVQHKKVFQPKLGVGRPRIRVIGFDNPEDLFSPSDVEEVHIVPDFSGGKKGGFVQILIGSALIVTSFANPAGLAELSVLGTTLGSIGYSLGASFLIGGILQIVAPVPKRDTPTSNEPEASKYLGAPKNTVKIGTRIPIGYGRHKVYGHFLSFDIDAKDVAT